MTTMSEGPVDRRTAATRPTMRHVAALAGVGLKTVSRVINGEPNVSAATMARVTEAATRLNYVPDIYAGNLKRTVRRTGTLGLLVGNVANPFSGTLHRAIEDAASERGIAVFASSLDEDPTRERDAVAAFLRRRVDGLILTTVAASQGYLIPEQGHGTPLVFVDREPIGIEADTVVVDNAAGAAASTRHLLDHDHRRIAFLGDDHRIFTAKQRKRGFLEEIARAGIPTNDVDIIEDLNEVRAREAVELLLRRRTPPTAIFSAQNSITVGAVRALRGRGQHHEIALIGFDDIELADLLEPRITVVAQNPQRIGELAARRIMARLDGDASEATKIIVPTVLIPRGSGEIMPRTTNVAR